MRKLNDPTKKENELSYIVKTRLNKEKNNLLTYSPENTIHNRDLSPPNIPSMFCKRCILALLLLIPANKRKCLLMI